MPELSVAAVVKHDGLLEVTSVPLSKMEYGNVGQSYVLLKREVGSMTMGKLGACLQFTVKEIDPSTGAARVPSTRPGRLLGSRLRWIFRLAHAALLFSNRSDKEF